MMLNELWNAEFRYKLSRALENLSERFEKELVVDNSNYVHVDGGAGDFGKVLYLAEDNEPLFIKVIESGAGVYWEVTARGYAKLARYIGYALSEVIETQIR